MAFSKRPGLKVPAPKTAAAKRHIAFKRTARPDFSWLAVNSDELKCALWVACQAGAAVMFSGAQGGRGVCIKLFVDGDKVTEYASDHEELDDLLAQLVDQMCEDGTDPRADYLMQPAGALTEAEIAQAESVLNEPADFLGGKPDLWGKVKGIKVAPSYSERAAQNQTGEGTTLTPSIEA